MAPSQSGKSFRSLLGVPASHPTPSDSVFVIVDAQNEYDHGALAIADVASSRKVIHNVLEKYREAKGDVVHVVHGTPEGAPVFTPGTELAEEFEELRPVGGEKVVRKVKPCSFSDTELHGHLKKLGKKKVVLGGMVTCLPPSFPRSRPSLSAITATNAHTLRLHGTHPYLPSHHRHPPFLLTPIHLLSRLFVPLLTRKLQAHVCISSTTRIGAELGYDISILRDGIGDRDIPGAKAGELVDVWASSFHCPTVISTLKRDLFFPTQSFLHNSGVEAEGVQRGIVE